MWVGSRVSTWSESLCWASLQDDTSFFWCPAMVKKKAKALGSLTTKDPEPDTPVPDTQEMENQETTKRVYWNSSSR